MTDTVEVVQSKRVQMMAAVKKDYEDVFSTPAGKRVLKDIMLSGVMERSAFNIDTHIMAANCGKQDFARHIAQMAEPEVKSEKPKRAKK
jgi:hypothetical protein